MPNRQNLFDILVKCRNKNDDDIGLLYIPTFKNFSFIVKKCQDQLTIAKF